jgi:predicted O-methyltransferase YrrM
MMPQPELFAMYQLACDCAADGDFVELGAWKGLTTCYLAAACRVRGRGHVFAVDTFAGTRENNTQYAGIAKSGGSTLDEFHRRICKAGHENLVTACVGYTTDVVHQHRDRPIAFLLIDADHSYEGAKADFDSWFPVVVPGGTIVFHDYAMPDAGVRDFVDREVATRSDVRVTPGNIVPNIFAITRAATTQTTTTHTANTHATTAHTTTTDTITTHTIASDATTDTTNSRGAATVVSHGRKPVEETPTSAMSPGRGGR